MISSSQPKTYNNKEYITPQGHYKLVSTPIIYKNGEKICIFNTIKPETDKPLVSNLM
jgi:hypothetical protein